VLCGDPVGEVHAVGHQPFGQGAEFLGLRQCKTGGIIEERQVGDLVVDAPPFGGCRQPPLLVGQAIQMLGKLV